MPVLAQTTSDAKFRAELPFILVESASDRNLNDLRFGCAAGKALELEARAKSAGRPHAAPDALCLAVLKEAAVKRSNRMYLYTEMQPGRAFEEWEEITAAAGKDRPDYINVEGIRKNLTCMLALDAGYVYGARNPQRAISPELTDAAVLKTASDCYLGASRIGSRAALTAGARIAQMHAKEPRAAPTR
jgi:hypothetical protein